MRRIYHYLGNHSNGHWLHCYGIYSYWVDRIDWNYRHRNDRNWLYRNDRNWIDRHIRNGRHSPSCMRWILHILGNNCHWLYCYRLDWLYRNWNNRHRIYCYRLYWNWVNSYRLYWNWVNSYRLYRNWLYS